MPLTISPQAPVSPLPLVSEAVRLLQPQNAANARTRKRTGGQLKGQIFSAGDFDDLPDDIAEAFGMKEVSRYSRNRCCDNPNRTWLFWSPRSFPAKKTGDQTGKAVMRYAAIARRNFAVAQADN